MQKRVIPGCPGADDPFRYQPDDLHLRARFSCSDPHDYSQLQTIAEVWDQERQYWREENAPGHISPQDWAIREFAIEKKHKKS